MEPIRSGSREFVPLDQLHLENLHETLEQFGVGPVGFDDARSTTSTRHGNGWIRGRTASMACVELGKHVIVGPLSNANLALLLRMALRAKLPWTVIVGSDATRGLQADPGGVPEHRPWMLRLDPGEVMLAAAHNRDLTSAQRAGLGTAFIPRPTEFGPGQTKDLAAEGDWDLVCASILEPQQPVRRCR